MLPRDVCTLTTSLKATVGSTNKFAFGEMFDPRGNLQYEKSFRARCSLYAKTVLTDARKALSALRWLDKAEAERVHKAGLSGYSSDELHEYQRCIDPVKTIRPRVFLENVYKVGSFITAEWTFSECQKMRPRMA